MKKKLYYSVFILFLFSFIVNSQTKRVLMEEYTGAWCGWCVDGTYMIDEIIKKYPDRVIAVKWHYSDKMEIKLFKEMQALFHIHAYPSGAIDRKKFNGEVPQGRGKWMSSCESRLNEAAKVDVNVVYNINEKTRKLMVKVNAKMLTTVDDSLMFNVIITEDSVSGKGSGWDQVNYISHKEGYEGHPYYNKPSVIKGYQHMKVVRAYLGGVSGVRGNFETPARQGMNYAHDFNYDLPDNWKIEHLHVIGYVAISENGKEEILNCAYGELSNSSVLLTCNDNNMGVGEEGMPFACRFTLKNISPFRKTFKIQYSKSERTPGDWEVDIPGLDSDTVTLDAGESYTFSLTLEPHKTVAVGDAILTVEDADNPNALIGTGQITVYSAKFTDIEVIEKPENKYALTPVLHELGYDNFIQIQPADYRTIAKDLLNLKHVIWNRGAISEFSGEDIEQIKRDMNRNIPVFVCGNNAATNLMGSNGLSGFFGAEFYGYSLLDEAKPLGQVWFSGIEGDAISSKLGKTIEGKLIRYYISLIKPFSQYSKPFLRLKFDGLRVELSDTFKYKAEDAVVGVKIDKNGYRAVLLSFSPFVIVNVNQRDTLTDRILKWMDGKINDTEVAANYNGEFSVFPIPATDEITFQFGEDAQDIKIYNIMGMLVDERGNLSGIREFVYNASVLPSGVYSAVLHGAGSLTFKRFAIVR